MGWVGGEVVLSLSTYWFYSKETVLREYERIEEQNKKGRGR